MILEDFGYMWRVEDELDNRRVKIGLTDKGEALYARVINVMRQRNVHLTRNMSDTEIDRFMTVIEGVERSAMDDLSAIIKEDDVGHAFMPRVGSGGGLQ